MNMSRTFQTMIAVMAVLATGIAVFSQEHPQKLPAEAKNVLSKDKVVVPVSALAQISGSIKLYNGGSVNEKNCTDVNVKITRLTNAFQDNQTTEVLSTTKATGGKIGNGCSYSVKVRKGPGTLVTASYPVNLLGMEHGPMVISGWLGPFNFTGDVTKNIVMNMQFF
jgi:hypothetical protein